jgi:spoIIIJ-associated protein
LEGLVIESREFVGENLDEAIAKAGKHFGVGVEQVDAKVLSSHMEISGLAGRTVILATVKDEPIEVGPAGEFLTGLLTRMGYSAPIRIQESESDGRIVIHIRDPRILDMFRRDGRVRGALAHLVARAAQKLIAPDVDVRLQTEGDDEEGEERLEELARGKAKEAQDQGKEVLLPPMNSRDRWIVHDTLKSISGIRTESVGDGRMKRVKIVPA